MIGIDRERQHGATGPLSTDIREVCIILDGCCIESVVCALWLWWPVWPIVCLDIEKMGAKGWRLWVRCD